MAGMYKWEPNCGLCFEGNMLHHDAIADNQVFSAHPLRIRKNYVAKLFYRTQTTFRVLHAHVIYVAINLHTAQSLFKCSIRRVYLFVKYIYISVLSCMLGEGCSGVSSRYSDFEIDAVLQQAEQLLGLQKVGNEGSQNYALPFNRSPHVHNIDSSSSLDHKEQVTVRRVVRRKCAVRILVVALPLPFARIQVLLLRLALREKDIELLEYKTHLQAVTVRCLNY